VLDLYVAIEEVRGILATLYDLLNLSLFALDDSHQLT
jgi:hypothetical protein